MPAVAAFAGPHENRDSAAATIPMNRRDPATA